MIEVENINEVRIRGHLKWHELEDIIGRHILKELTSQGIDRARAEMGEITIEIRQEEEGSPSYKVSRWEVRFRGVLPAAEPAG